MRSVTLLRLLPLFSRSAGGNLFPFPIFLLLMPVLDQSVEPRTSEHPHDLQLSTPIYSYLQFKTPIAGGNLIFFRFVLRFLSLRFSASPRFEPSASSDKGYQSLSKVIKASCSSSSSSSGPPCRSFRAAARTKLSLRLPADSR